MALTVPKGSPMPAGGWPLLVYAHGTGGSFRSHVPEGVAARMAAVGVAVLGIDQVEHGTRRGASQESPDNLFYNFANPAAARGNPLQGAADQVSLVRFATGFDLPAAQSPTQAEIKIGPLAFWGHSQGATEGGIAMPYTSGVCGAVMSGQGASLMDALVTKTNPVDVVGGPAGGARGSEGRRRTTRCWRCSRTTWAWSIRSNHAAALVASPLAAVDRSTSSSRTGRGTPTRRPSRSRRSRWRRSSARSSPPAA